MDVATWTAEVSCTVTPRAQPVPPPALPAEQFLSCPALGQEASGALAPAALQQELFTGAVDGGGVEQRAVKFQRSQGLPVTGMAITYLAGFGS